MTVSAEIRRAVAERAHGRCEYCRCPSAVSSSSYAVEHIHPRDLGGTDDLDNLACSCQGCNSYKGTATDGTDPATGARALLYHPRRHSWREHFQWSDDGLLLIGITPSARATIVRLKLNRPGVVTLRRLLTLAGEHPPSEENP